MDSDLARAVQEFVSTLCERVTPSPKHLISRLRKARREGEPSGTTVYRWLTKGEIPVDGNPRSEKVVQFLAHQTSDPEMILDMYERLCSLARGEPMVASPPSALSTSSEHSEWFAVVPDQPNRPYSSVDRLLVHRLDPRDVYIESTRIMPIPAPGTRQHWFMSGVAIERNTIFITFWSDVDSQYMSRGVAFLVGTDDDRFEGEYFRRIRPERTDVERRAWYWTTRRPQLALENVALLDLDNTLHAGWAVEICLRKLASEALGAFEAQVAAYRSGDISHDELAQQSSSTVHQAIRDAEPRAVQQASQEAAAEVLSHLHPYVRPLIAHLLEYEIAPVLVSGAPDTVVGLIANDLGVDEWYAWDWRHSETAFGTLAAKAQLVETIGSVYRRQIRLAVGDSESDRALWDAAELAVYVGDEALLGAPSLTTFTLSLGNLSWPPLEEWLTARVASPTG